jgi:diguanylate cyclase (GGDEF)-like protein
MGTRYPLLTDAITVGRGDDCDIQIPDHSVSRRHAEVQHAENGIVVTDLQSTNGTFVNDQPVTTARLHDGDYLRVGNCIYRFLAGGNVESEYHEEIYRLTIVDGLTQIHNKRYLLEFLDRELSRSSRHQRPLSLVMLDIDYFKTINDDLGHLGGDFTLRELAGVIRESVRHEDLFARYGGDEFTLVLVETPLEGAVDVAERIRESVAKYPFRFEDRPFSLTISIGMAFTSGDSSLTAAALLRLADEKLYEAKRAGRNRIVQ